MGPRFRNRGSRFRRRYRRCFNGSTVPVLWTRFWRPRSTATRFFKNPGNSWGIFRSVTSFTAWCICESASSFRGPDPESKCFSCYPTEAWHQRTAGIASRSAPAANTLARSPRPCLHPAPNQQGNCRRHAVEGDYHPQLAAAWLAKAAADGSIELKIGGTKTSHNSLANLV